MYRIFNKITKEEFFKNDYCIKLDDEKLTDDLDEYVESEVNCWDPDLGENVINFIESHQCIPVFEKKYFKLPKGFLEEKIEDYMYDSWDCEDPECHITDYESIDKFEEEFNSKQHGWYVQAEEVGYMDLSLDIKEMLEE